MMRIVRSGYPSAWADCGPEAKIAIAAIAMIRSRFILGLSLCFDGRADSPALLPSVYTDGMRVKTDTTRERMGPRNTPPFRADHVGSLIRPDKLLSARAAAEKGEIKPQELL